MEPGLESKTSDSGALSLSNKSPNNVESHGPRSVRSQGLPRPLWLFISHERSSRMEAGLLQEEDGWEIRRSRQQGGRKTWALFL